MVRKLCAPLFKRRLCTERKCTEKKEKKGEYDQVTVLTLEYLIPVEKDDCFVTF